MAGVLQTSQPLGERFTLPASNSPGNVDVIIASLAAIAGPGLREYLLNVGSVPAWWVSTSGDDSNDGQSASRPFRTAEKLSATLCPGGVYCPFQQNTDVNFSAGAFGGLAVFADWPATDAPYAKRLRVQGTTTGTTVGITAITNTAVNATRGQVTLTGPLVQKRRLRTLNGATPGAVAFGMGPNGPSNFVSNWWNYDTGTLVNIANGTNVQIDLASGTTFATCIIGARDPNYIELRDCGLPNGATFETTTSNFLIFPINCDLAGGFFGSYSAEGCRIVGPMRHSSGFGYFDGCSIQATLSAIAGGYLELGKGNSVDGGQLIIGNYGGAPGLAIGSLATINSAFPVEWENGVPGVACDIFPGGVLQINSQWWGQGFSPTPWGTGFRLSSGALAVTGSAGFLLVPATQALTMTGHNLPYASVPLTYPRASCTFALNPDPAAVAVTL